jgi:hypothetical protein
MMKAHVKDEKNFLPVPKLNRKEESIDVLLFSEIVPLGRVFEFDAGLGEHLTYPYLP